MTALAMVSLGAISAKAVWTGVVQRDALTRLALNENTKPLPLLAPRGQILSANAQALAQDRPAARVEVDPGQITNPKRVAELIAKGLGKPAAEVEALLAKPQSRNQVLASYLSPEAAAELRRVKRERLVDGKVIDGLDLYDVLERVVPQGPVGSQVVGLVKTNLRTAAVDGTKLPGAGDTKVGVSGLEQRYNAELTGVDGIQVDARDPAGRTIRTLRTTPAKPGKNLRTGIHPGIQSTTQEVLDSVVARTGAKSASALVMRPSDGLILAMASNPGFDPNDRASLSAGATNVGSVTEVSEPGSVMKLVTVAAALQEGIVTPSTIYRRVDPTAKIYNITLGEAHRDTVRDMSTAEIIRSSSNVGTYRMALDLGQPRFLKWASRFGFGRATGVDLPGEAAGFVRQTWSGVDISQLPIGQGLTSSQIQMARAYAVVANGGLLVTPHVVAKVGGKPVKIPAPVRVLRPNIAAQLNAILEGVVGTGGTGERAAINGYRVAGKTGTANIFDPTLINSDGTKGGYSNRHIASFVGYVPANRPQLLIAVTINEPGPGEYYGGEIAAPAFKEIAEYSLQHLAIAP